jgi:Protein of unknown function (DUF3892)
MAEYQVTCINKLDHLDRHEDVTHVGNVEDQWRLTVEGAIYQIEKKVSQFYTLNRSTRKRSYLEVVRQLGKAPYLKAHADGKWTDDLLTQTECGEHCRIVS